MNVPKFKASPPLSNNVGKQFAMPTIYTLELSTLCNNRCSGCANVEVAEQRQKKTDNPHVYMTHWKDIVFRIYTATNGKAIIRLSGGEPTLHPQFDEIVRYIETLKMYHVLLTTGKWSKIGAEKLIQIYQNASFCLGFLISLHGANAKIHQAFIESSENSFAETLKNIELASQQGITVFTNTVITTLNCTHTEIEKIINLSQKVGAKYAVFNRFIANKHHLLPTENQLLEAIKTIKTLSAQGIKCRIGNNIPPCFYPLSSYPNPSGYELCYINPLGNVRPENLLAYSVGNILKHDIKSIWRAKPIENYRNHAPTQCLECAAFNSCRGGIKSLYFLNGQQQDNLMKGTLNLEKIQIIDEDEEKKQIQILALTSD